MCILLLALKATPTGLSSSLGFHRLSWPVLQISEPSFHYYFNTYPLLRHFYCGLVRDKEEVVFANVYLCSFNPFVAGYDHSRVASAIVVMTHLTPVHT